MGDVVDSVVERVGGHLREQFGGEPAASASVTFLGLEPIDVRCYLGEGAMSVGSGPDAQSLIHFASVGGSRTPMNDPTAMINDPESGPRAEVIVSLHPSGGPPAGLHRSVAVLAAAPAVEGVILAPDGIVDLSEPMWAGSGFTAVLLGESGVPDLVLDPPREPVRFLEAIPITATEAAWVRVRGAGALRDAWSEAGVDCHDPARRAVSL
ncbi:MAG: suppressor of fused domain protein [Tomitella sp.]|nr:suppressor of fused domain protein [Tomitella sp.]